MISALEIPSVDPLMFLRLFAEMMMVYDKLWPFCLKWITAALIASAKQR